MKQLPILLACSLCFLTSLLQAQTETKQKPVTTAELNQRSLVGKLGIPLGTATEIEAEIVSWRSLRFKKYQSAYLLKITHVAGRKIDKSITVEFNIPGFASVELANDTFSLYELRNGKKTGKLDSSQIDDLENGYVGKSVRLVVYESGGFSGRPNNLPKDVPLWQDTGFHFSTYLYVVAERKK